MFCEFDESAGLRVWRLKKETFDLECLRFPNKFATSVIVLGYLTSPEPGMLGIVSRKNNSLMYEEILEHFMVLSSLDIYDDDFVCQQVSVSSCTFKSTTKRHQEKK